MATKRIIADPDFGRIEIRTNARARNITMRAKEDGLRVTVPPYAKTAEVMRAIEPFRGRLAESFRKIRPKRLDTGFCIDAPCFKLTVETGGLRHFSVRQNDGRTTIYCPPGVDFALPEVQKLLRGAVLRAMKRQAALFLPPLLEEWSRRYTLPYRKVRITGARSKWGSCSGAKTISLSCYLLLLPPELIDFVMLHELAHTREMNHGPAFYDLLNAMTEGQEPRLRKALKSFRPSF